MLMDGKVKPKKLKINYFDELDLDRVVIEKKVAAIKKAPDNDPFVRLPGLRGHGPTEIIPGNRQRYYDTRAMNSYISEDGRFVFIRSPTIWFSTETKLPVSYQYGKLIASRPKGPAETLEEYCVRLSQYHEMYWYDDEYCYQVHQGVIKRAAHVGRYSNIWHKADEVWYDQYRMFGPPDSVWSNDHDRWFHKDEPIPPIAPTFAQLGLTIQSYPSCCGARVLVGWYEGVGGKWSKDDWIAGINKELNQYRGKTTGMIQVVLNPTQNPKYKDILLAVGFDEVAQYTNYAHNHPNYLYIWFCDKNSEQVIEKKRSFG